ncbi:MAG: cobalamin biosynthesis protein CobW [Ruminococcaceae bacterium]|nr:cobalamin biosynthesis protein CobW [Oscillospiraceae bacterium]
MTKIDLFSGFLGAGKTTLIKKLIQEGYQGEKLVLIENEFGEIGIDGGFLQDAGVTVNEMNSGCICCSLVGDFSAALKQVLDEYKPDRILIEPSGVGKLSDVIRAVEDLKDERVSLHHCCTVVDAKKCKMYMKNFGEFFNDQIQAARVIVLSHTDGTGEEKLSTCLELIRSQNKDAAVMTTPWDQLTGKELLDAMEHSLEQELKELLHEHHHHEHCDCHEHHHDHDEHCGCHEHHHHDEHCGCHEHHHHDEHCSCGHHHHAEEVFTSWGKETVRSYTVSEIQAALEALEETAYGTVLRAKGIVSGKEGEWIHFDYIPGEVDVRIGSAAAIGRLCVIGADLKEEKLTQLFLG